MVAIAGLLALDFVFQLERTRASHDTAVRRGETPASTHHH
jgi:hypothetical protein